MAITQSQITVTTSVTLLVGPDYQPQRVTLHNVDNGTNKQVYLGNASVSTSNSMHINTSERIALTLDPGDALYGISLSSAVVGVLIQKQD